MAKQRNGIYQRAGSPFWYFDVVDANGKRVRNSTRTTDKAKAQEVADKRRSQSWDIKAGKTPNHTFAEAVARWLDEKCDKRSIADDDRILTWWSGKLGSVALAKLTRDLLMAHLNKKRAEASGPTANRYMAVMRALLRKAEREWQWLKQPAPVLSAFPESDHRMRWLKEPEIKRLLKELPDHQRAMATFALATGMRQGNVINLRWADIDMDRKVAWLKGSAMKNGQPFGTVLNNDAMAVLKAEAGKHAVYVFTYRGQPIQNVNTKTWQDALTRAGITDFRWHDLRHTWASRMVQAGVPLHVLQRMGGWERAEMVMVYAHLAPDHLAPYAATVDGLVEEAA